MTRAAPTRMCRLRRMRRIEWPTSLDEPSVEESVRLPGRDDQEPMHNDTRRAATRQWRRMVVTVSHYIHTALKN
jgi:hypothetical protein